MLTSAALPSRNCPAAARKPTPVYYDTVLLLPQPLLPLVHITVVV